MAEVTCGQSLKLCTCCVGIGGCPHKNETKQNGGRQKYAWNASRVQQAPECGNSPSNGKQCDFPAVKACTDPVRDHECDGRSENHKVVVDKVRGGQQSPDQKAGVLKFIGHVATPEPDTCADRTE